MASNRSPRSRAWLAALACAAALAVWPAVAPARAWTPTTHQTIAWEAARLAPPDLARQLIKRHAAYLAGVIQPFDDSDASRHRKDPDGGSSLDVALEDAVTQAVAAIRAHHSFDDIVFRMGVAAHFMADANNPLASSQADPEAGRYFVDFLRYAEKGFDLVAEHRAWFSELGCELETRAVEVRPRMGNHRAARAGSASARRAAPRSGRWCGAPSS